MKILILVLFLVPFVLCSQGKKPSCEEFIRDSTDCLRCHPDGKKIYLYNSAELNGPDAENECRKKHGHVVVPENSDETAFLAKFLMDKDPSVTEVWTGINDVFSTNTLTGVMTTEAPTFTFGTCASLTPGGVIASIACDPQLPSICQINYFEGSTYFIPAYHPADSQHVTRNWEAACKDIDNDGILDDEPGTMVTIDSVQENLYLTELLQSRGLTGEDEGVWTGLQYIQTCEKYQWSSGSYAVYRKWCSSQPKLLQEETSVNGGELENECVTFTALDNVEKGCLTVTDCGVTTTNAGADPNLKLYICEKKSKCEEENSVHDFATVIRQQIGGLKRQCKSCNKKGIHRG